MFRLQIIVWPNLFEITFPQLLWEVAKHHYDELQFHVWAYLLVEQLGVVAYELKSIKVLNLSSKNQNKVIQLWINKEKSFQKVMHKLGFKTKNPYFQSYQGNIA